MALALIAFVTGSDAGEFGEILRWSQTVVDLAAGNPTKGAGFGVGSPLASRWHIAALLGGGGPSRVAARPLRRRRDGPKPRPDNRRRIVTWTYGLAMHYGVLRADDSAVRAIEEAVQTAQRRATI